MKKWLAHLSIISDAYNDKLNDTDSAIILETSAPSTFIATFDENSAVRKVADAIRKVALQSARNKADEHVQPINEAYTTVKDVFVVKFDGCKTTCPGNDWNDEKLASLENALKSEQPVRSALQYYEKPSYYRRPMALFVF